MTIQPTPSTSPRLSPYLPVTPGPAPQSGGDGFSPSRAVAGGILTFMGRRIPTTVPEIGPDRVQHLKNTLQPGDVILTCDCSFPGWARMEFWTVRSNYTHAAYYAGDGKIYEAVGGGVQEAKLDDFFEGRLKVALIRPPYKDPASDVKAATAFCQAQVGKAYDSVFSTDDDKEFYCSELVYKALKSMPNPIDSPSRQLLGRAAVAPDAFFGIQGAKVVHDDGSDYWKNKLGHWPLAATAVAGAVAGSQIGGLAGAGVGFATGLLGSILVGNYVQTGHALPSLTDK